MPFFLNSVLKDLQRFRRDAATLGVWFAMPVILVTLMWLAFGSAGPRPHGTLLLADQDRGLAGVYLREAIGRSALGRMVALEATSPEEGRARMNRGDASALLVVPVGFDDAIRFGRPAALELVTNPQQEFIPLMVRELAGTLVDSAFYLQRSVPDGDLLRAAPGWFSANRYLNPPLVTVTETAPSRAGPQVTVSQMLFPGSMFLVALMLGAGLSIEIWKERAAGSLRRLTTTGSGILPFAAGRAAAMLLVYLVAVGLLFLGERFLIGVPMQMPVTAWLWTAGCGLALHLAMVCIQLAVGRERTATTVANGVMLPLAILGGSFFPLDIMPARIAALGKLTPNGWASQQLASIVSGSLPPGAVAWCFTALAATIVGALLLMSRLLRRTLVNA